MALSILIAHNSDLIRTRFVRLASALPSVDAVFGAASLEQALHILERNRPSVVMLDTRLPGSSTDLSIRALKSISPTVRIAMLSDAANSVARRDCLAIGADQFFDISAEFETALDWICRQAN